MKKYTLLKKNSEIEFLIDNKGIILPVEVKSGLRTKAKSLAQFIAKYSPDTAYTLSGKNISAGSGVRQNVPLYYACKFSRFITDG